MRLRLNVEIHKDVVVFCLGQLPNSVRAVSAMNNNAVGTVSSADTVHITSQWWFGCFFKPIEIILMRIKYLIRRLLHCC